jgi:ABC-type branched-subunit amino acid transport system ATPase component/ABC-type branched-subunit amino acid transport system permease subunit
MVALLGLNFNQTLLDLVVVNTLYAYSAYYGLMGGGFVLLFVGFIGMGAYTFTLVVAHVTPSITIGLLLAVLICIAVAAVVLLPLRRLEGVYLGIVSLVFVSLLQTIELGWQSVTGGSTGLTLALSVQIGTAVLVPVALAIIGMTAIVGRSTLGLLIRSRRHDTLLTSSLGVDVSRLWYCLGLVSAGLAGLAGGLSASWYGFISPSTYSFQLIVLTIAMVMLGGSDHWIGPLIGATILTLLTQEFVSLINWSYVVVGAVLLVIVLIAPSGIAGTIRRLIIRRRREANPEVATPEQALTLEQAPPMDESQTVKSSAAEAEDRLAKRQKQDAMIEARDISWRVAGLQILDDISLSVSPGEVCGLIGPNGSGKSSLMNVLSGITQSDQGQVLLNGEDLTGKQSHLYARSGLSRTFQGVRLLEDETVRSNVEIAAWRANRFSRLRRLIPGRDGSTAQHGSTPEEVLTRTGHLESAGRLAGDVSHGTRRMTEFARALVPNPEVLLLDEPTSGVSVETVSLMKRLVSEEAKRGCAILLVDHDLSVIRDVCDRVIVLDAGKMIYDGSVDGALADTAVREAFLGT